MYNSSCLIIYSFPKSLINSSWWSYPCRGIQFFCWTEGKSLHFVLPCVLLKRFREKWIICKKIVFLSNIVKGNGMTSSTNRMLLFWQRNKNDPQGVFRQESSSVRSLHDIYSFVASLIITLTFYSTLYLIQSKWSRRPEKRKDNIKCLSTLSRSWRNL